MLKQAPHGICFFHRSKYRIDYAISPIAFFYALFNSIAGLRLRLAS
jgi:hypothetical protein